MIVSVPLHLVIPLAVSIVAVIVSMLICAHDLMLIRAMFVWTFLRADHGRHKPAHRNSRQGKQCRFPKMLAHVAILLLREKRMLGRPTGHGNSRRLTGPVGASLRPVPAKVPLSQAIGLSCGEK
jgi:hypothetical protein